MIKVIAVIEHIDLLQDIILWNYLYFNIKELK